MLVSRTGNPFPVSIFWPHAGVPDAEATQTKFVPLEQVPTGNVGWGESAIIASENRDDCPFSLVPASGRSARLGVMFDRSRASSSFSFATLRIQRGTHSTDIGLVGVK